MSMSVGVLDHYNVSTRNLRDTVRFYEEVLGLPLVEAMSGDDWEGRPWLLMFFGLADGRQLALSCFRGATWQVENAEPNPNNPVTDPGIYDVKSGSEETAMDGTKYSDWD